MKKGILAELLTIGDEILFGQITNTNAQWMSDALDKIGVKVVRQSTVGDVAEDILQEGFYKILRDLKQWSGEGEIGAWMRKVMVNTALMHLRKYRKMEFSDLEDVSPDDPSLLNLDLAYVNYELGLDAGLHYNVFGERLSDVSLGGTPDVFEQPRNMLNFTFNQRLVDNLNIKFSARNILDARMERLYRFKGQEYFNTQYDLGTTFALGFSYTFE